MLRDLVTAFLADNDYEALGGECSSEDYGINIFDIFLGMIWYDNGGRKVSRSSLLLFFSE